MFIFFTIILFARSQVATQFENLIYFTSNVNPLQLPAYILLPLIFIGITAIFTILSQDLGMLLNQFPPLTAYNLNILGSLAGIASFTLISALSLPSWVWMLIAAVLLTPLLPRGRSFGNNILLLAGVVLIFTASDFAYANIWSPYYRLDLMEVKEKTANRFSPSQMDDRPNDLLLLANGVAHQIFYSVEQGPSLYQLPYSAFPQKQNFQNALIVGAGGGNDVAFALANGVQHVDAVEIDPRIAELGEKYHPDNPYGDPRVTLYIDDARSFLEKTDTHYDLIIFALPDSLVLAATTSNLRLESYLFTLESFQSVKEHLKPNGLFVLYNFYRYDWLIDKINDMLYGVFGEPPIYHRYSEPQLASFATLFAGPKSKEVDLHQPGFARAHQQGFTPATDNWPFLYIKKPSLPIFYIGTLLIILIFSFVYIQTISQKGVISQHGLTFFFMGAAFILLEAKSIVQFLLLFGSTWLVNSLVFFAVLLVVLIANWLAARYKFTKVWILYVFLFLALAANLFIPLKTFLFDNLTIRYILATIFLFSPIFFANLIYSNTFRDTEQANVAFGANLLGTVIGGATEYLSLYIGYQGLIFLVGLFYFCAFYSFRRMKLKSSVISHSVG